jgi:hypothetical protein
MRTEEEIKHRIQFLENGIIYAETHLDNISSKEVYLNDDMEHNQL